MTSAIAPLGTPVLPRAASSVPPAFKRAFERERPGLLGYTEPYVIMEKLATDFPEPLSTRFYTSAYAQRNSLQPTSEQVFQFPDGFRLEHIVQRFRTILTAASVQHGMAPEAVDQMAELVAFKYKPRYVPTSPDFKNIFLPLLYGALGLIVQQYQGRLVQNR